MQGRSIFPIEERRGYWIRIYEKGNKFMKLCKDCKNRGRNCNLYPSMSNFAEECKYFKPKTDVWIPRSERMPENEKEVEIRDLKGLRNDGE